MDVAIPQEKQYFSYEDHIHDAGGSVLWYAGSQVATVARPATPISINTKVDDSRVVEIYKALEQVAQPPRR